MLRRRRVWLVSAVVMVGLLSGCPADEATDNIERDAAIYRAVIIDLVDRSGVELDGGENLPVLFVEALGPDGIALGVQVGVVGGLIDQYEVRFIDQLDEAVDEELPGLPVREGSLLIGLGDIDVDQSAEVHAEIYLAADDIRGFGYTVVDMGNLHWDVVGNPLDVDPEGLVPES